MHSALLLSTLGFTLIRTIHAFEFTGPDSTQKLDITQPIKITWNATSEGFVEPKAQALQLWFLGVTNNGNDKPGWELASNLSLSEGSYEWNPENVVESLKATDGELSSDAVHMFEARLMDNAGKKLVTIESDRYAIEGDDVVESSGKGAQAGFYTSGVALIVALLAGLRTSGCLM
ncbi:hypothetical protein FLONG3_8803 [Fusarium longipes]|uniref:Uncharacterized protein n=1 Tax=Fusarium longipes TaxID=694270 RepID=A0A395S2X8_9HYPO|nr:hypothetical protein FLONG3_8803 [Fusarium longipes]